MTIRPVYEKNAELVNPDAKTYKVTFLNWEGKVITTQNVEEGKNATAPTAPEVKGYHFVKWDSDFTNVKADLVAVSYTHLDVYKRQTLVFLPAVSSFVIPKLMGGGGYMMIGNVIENQFITVGEWNFGSAISMIMAVIIMISMYVTRRLDKGEGSVRAKRGGGNVQ